MFCSKKLLLALSFGFLIGCGGGDESSSSVLGECDGSPEAGATVFTTSCVGSCHAQGQLDPASEGESIYTRASLGEMPPAPISMLSDADIESLRIYLACEQ